MGEQTEAERQREFEKDKLCFEQNSEHLRSLNGLMWQVPLIAMTLTGGLWYGIAQLQPNSTVALSLLILATATDFLLIFVMLRMRFIFGRILQKTRDFHPSGAADTTNHKYLKDSLVIWIFSILLALATVLSLYGACKYRDLLKPNAPQEIHLTMDKSLQNFNCVINQPTENNSQRTKEKIKGEKNPGNAPERFE